MRAIHKMRGVTPNDPKLSDRGARRGTCMVGGKAAAEAGAVTCGAVRCSAWLGVTLLGKTAQTTTGQKRESALRMKLREDQNGRLVEAGETTEAGKLGLAETVERWERQTAVLGEDMKLRLTKACVSGTGMDSRQTLREA